MEPRTKERVERWDSRPFTGGYDGLVGLADEGFSGAVSARGTWLFMLNGRIVGVVDGTIENFDDASGTVYAAPDPALPLLCSMTEQGGNVQANYYTNETPLEEVDQTLQNGSFTGYVELSERVLSGDYYLVYYGGKRMAAAYIGNAERLLTDDEAFERAADEVGIYEVVDVDVEVTDVPADSYDEPSDPTHGEKSSDPTPGHDANGLEQTDEEGHEPTEVDEAEPVEAESIEADSVEAVIEEDDPGGITTSVEYSETTEPDGIMDDGSADPEEASQSSPTADAVDESGATPMPPVEDDDDVSITEAEPHSSSGDPTEPSRKHESGDPSPKPADIERAADDLDGEKLWGDLDDESEGGDARDDPQKTRTDSTGEMAGSATGGGPTSGDGAAKTNDESPRHQDKEERFKREEQWRKTRQIPSIDPESTSDRSRSGGRTARNARRQPRNRTEPRSNGPASKGTRTESGSGTTETRETNESSSTARPTDETRQHEEPNTALESDMLEREDRIDQLTQKVEALEQEKRRLVKTGKKIEAERNQLRTETAELEATVDRLTERIDRLETELEEARSRGTEPSVADSNATASSTTASTQLPPDRALSETNLFVRYGSKSQPTLVTAHEEGHDRDAVGANVRLEHHTGFDADDTSVLGQPYDQFLAETMEYQFVDWLVTTLLFEIRETSNADGLGDLYDAIPKIDRAELDGTISLEDDDTEDVPEYVSFDVIAYDKMGNPLVVANLNDSRDPATEDMLVEMEETASAVFANYPDLGAAIVVTSSYFEPGALEVAERATSGSFLSRNSKRSYVNHSRKQGYHLCLVESRSGGFHVNVPEL